MALVHVLALSRHRIDLKALLAVAPVTAVLVDARSVGPANRRVQGALVVIGASISGHSSQGETAVACTLKTAIEICANAISVEETRTLQ